MMIGNLVIFNHKNDIIALNLSIINLMNEADNNNLDINNLVKILYLDKSIIFASIVFF